jgi:hypothetical protein
MLSPATEHKPPQPVLPIFWLEKRLLAWPFIKASEQCSVHPGITWLRKSAQQDL